MAKGMYVGVGGSRPLLSYNVGDTVKLDIAYGMGLKDHIIVHRGKPNDYYGGDADGIWVMAKTGFLASKWSDDGLNNYSSINLGIQNASILYSAEVQNIIKTIKIPYYHDYTSELNYGENGVEVKFFIPSADEMGYNNVSMHQYSDRGLFLPPLDYFKNNSISKPNGITTWTRSPNLDNNTTAFFISSSGTVESASCSDVNYANYIFVLPYNAEVKDGTVTGQLYDAATANGVSRKVTKIYCGVKKTEADYTSVQKLSELAVGTIIKIKENGVDSDYIVVNQGPPENTLYPDSPSPFYENADGTWLMRKNALNGAKYFYQDSSIYPTFFGKYFLNDNFFYCLPKKLQKIIKKVKIPYVSSLEPTVITFGTSGDENKIFMPGFTELGIFAPTNMVQIDSCGTLEYFKDLEITNEKYAIKDDTGADAPFFVRSPTTMATVIGEIDYDFAPSSGVLSVHKGGFGSIVPMMVLPYETAVLDGEVTGHLYGDYPSVARKVKKAYIGINSLARLYWSGATIKHHSNPAFILNDLSIGLTIGKYAVFGGGRPTLLQDFYSIDETLTLSARKLMTVTRQALGGATVNGLGLFGGGYHSSTCHKTVDAFDSSFTKCSAPELSVGLAYPSACSTKKYAIFAGGRNWESGNAYYNYVHAYNSSLTLTMASNLSSAAAQMASAASEKYACFFGGLGRYSYNTVDAYDDSLTKTRATSLPTGRYNNAAAAFDDCVLVGGGSDGNSPRLTSVLSYSSSLTQTSLQDMSCGRIGNMAERLGDEILFAGMGWNGDTSTSADVYDSSFTRRTIVADESTAYYHDGGSSATIGNYAIVGGMAGSSLSSGGNAVIYILN